MQIEAPIDRVRVHHRGATVTRRIVLDDPPADLRVIGLPLCLQDGTVQARIVGVAGATAAPVGVTLHVRPPDAVETPPEADLREAARALQRIKRDLEVQKAERSLFQQIPVLPRAAQVEGQAPQPSPFAARVAQGAFVGELLAERDARIARLEAEAREAQRAVDAAQAALQAASTARSALAAPVTKAVNLRLDGIESGPVTLEIDYRVPGARWAPQYQIRLAADGARAEIVLRAAVAQASGEDWRGVALELSTASPIRVATRPTLNALKIGEAQPPAPARPERPPPRGAAALFAAYDAARQGAPAVGGGWRAPRVEQVPRPDVHAPRMGVIAQSAPAGPHVGSAFGGATEAVALDDLAVAEMAAPPPSASAPRMAAPPAPAPARRSRSASAKKMRKGSRGAPGGAPRDPAPPATPTDYASLQLGAPAGPHRGQLMPLDDAARYAEGLRASGRKADVDALSLVRSATQRANSVASLPAGAADVREAAGNHDYLYRADARIDVAGDGAWHTIPVSTRAADCRTRYVVVPRVDPGVYRVATLHNPIEAPLLPGEAEVYVDGEYVLSTAVPFVSAAAEVELGLGVEQRLRCARNTRFEEQRSAEAVVAMTDLVHRIEITLSNGLGRPADCEIRERIPHPAEDAEVVVEERAVSPAWDTWNQRERGRPIHGGRRWRVEVPAGAEQVLTAEYAVRIYAKNALVGGNRREG